ncbi:High spontaneous mutagenesis 2 [Hyphodiscus hymeniophilus]|uniref:High spontaneous mutagenesis 2 n=1 Tax=Hyphodiscus hymeniophilus TaxID=353542 RepID=A0A9P6VP51_9HELO|nr:High spontaneous mutagenesis 2 [Hyphodiscus hymeniophilus]
MAKTKKAEDKAKAGATLEIDVDSFVRTRDSVVTGLATLQDAIQTLSTAYIKHTNAVLGEHGAGLDVGSALSKLGENPLLGPLANLQRAVTPAASAPVVIVADGAADEKKRKKRQHDPNAPKRPLTPFFLYMQTARPIIAKDLGPDVAKGAVSEEGTRRWKEMEEKDRTLWSNAYKDNLRLYNARMHSYKSGTNPDAKDMTEQEAILYAEEHNIGADTTADAQLVGEAAAVPEDVDAEGEPEKEPTPPPKTPKAKSSGRKAKKGTPAEIAPAPAPAPTVAPIVPAVAPASEKKETPVASNKRKRAKKGEEPAAVEPEEAPKSTPKPRQKKKAKADA